MTVAEDIFRGVTSASRMYTEVRGDKRRLLLSFRFIYLLYVLVVLGFLSFFRVCHVSDVCINPPASSLCSLFSSFDVMHRP